MEYDTPGGNVYKCMHRLPSGVKMTNLIGTIITLIATDFCANDNKNLDFNYAAGGDDFIVSYCGERMSKETGLENFSKRILELGMNFKFLLIKDSKSIAKIAIYLSESFGFNSSLKEASNKKSEPLILQTGN